jgi:transcriptional regulator with XRE-family HTH domain
MAQRTYSPIALEAARLLGARIRLARTERRWTINELASRIGVTPPTVRKIERGDPSVRLGAAFEAAAVVGVVLFHADPQRRGAEMERVVDRLTLLPERVRRPREVDDDF